MRAFYVSSFLGEPPFSHFVSISNYIRGKVSRLASRGRGYKFDVDMDMESNISAYLVSSSFSRRSSSGRSSDFLSGALLGDRTVSDLSRALISRLSGVQSNMRESLFFVRLKIGFLDYTLCPLF